mmetsp:Transcript_101847/g.276897  ORF Transcript_101847/g.276897 Transcript_101847/m.276897 type:complete len:552 (-) Transcript_101847:16-1671(-)
MVRGGQQAGQSREPTETTPLQLSSGSTGQVSTGVQKRLGWARNLCDQLSWQLVGSIFITHFVLKGIVAGGGDEGLIGKPVEFLLGGMHVPASRLQALVSISTTAPWVLKPMIGFLSDAVPICGYRKNSYIGAMTVLSSSAVFALAFGWADTPATVVVAVFFASLQVAGASLLVDAKQSQVAKEHASLGPELIAFRETCMNSGVAISVLLLGPLIYYTGPRTPYLVALPLTALLLVIPAGNWLQERRLEPGERSLDLGVIRSNPHLFALGLCLLPLLVALACGSLAGIPERALLAAAVVASLTVLFGYGVAIRPEISKPVVFYFVMRCLNLQINGALFYFFTDPPSALADGPHLSPVFYVTAVTSVAVVGRMVGFITAKSLLSHWRYDRALLAAVPLVAMSQLMLVPLILRWNVAIGIPDRAWLLVWAFCDMVVRAWRQFPLSLVLLHATPKGLEASTLALNSSAVNMGMVLSFYFGGFVLHSMGVRPAGLPSEAAQFDGLWKVQALAALLPLLALPLLPALMPRATQVQALISESPGSATHGAPVERCCGV